MLVQERVRTTCWMFLLLSMLGCEEGAILTDQAMDQAAASLVKDFASKIRPDMRIGVPPFEGDGLGQDMAEKVKKHLQQRNYQAVVLPDSPMWTQISEVIDGLQLSEDALSGDLPEMAFEIPQHVILGRFLWVRSERGLSRVGVSSTLVKMHPKPVRILAATENHGAYVEYHTIILRGALFLFLSVAIAGSCRMSYLAAQRNAVILGALALLLIVAVFYWLLWDYVFFLWKAA